MSKEQIEEMENTYYEAMLIARGTIGSMNEGVPKWYAKAFYNAGYRKQIEVAREIFEEIGNSISPMLGLEDDQEYVAILATNFAKLKKKYTEG